MAQKQSVMFALGSVSKSPHHLEAIEASEFIWHETNYNARTTDEMLEKHLPALAKAEHIAIGGDGFIDDRLLGLCPNLKVISVVGVGYDNVDVDACTRHNVWLANAPVLRESCADMALLLMLSAMREAAIGSLIAKGAEPYPHDDRGWDWRVMRNVVGQDPGGKTLGLIGLGRIGQTFAAKAQAAFNMKVIYFDPIQQVRSTRQAPAPSLPYPTSPPAAGAHERRHRLRRATERPVLRARPAAAVGELRGTAGDLGRHLDARQPLQALAADDGQEGV